MRISCWEFCLFPSCTNIFENLIHMVEAYVHLTANFQCTLRTNLLKLTNPYISLERYAKRGTIGQKYTFALFNTIVLSVFAASDSDLTPVQCFLDRCFKRKCMAKPVSVHDFLERQDRKFFRKVLNSTGHPLSSKMRRFKPSSYHLKLF